VSGTRWIGVATALIALFVAVGFALQPDTGPEAFIGGWFGLGLVGLVLLPLALASAVGGTLRNYSTLRRNRAARTTAAVAVTVWGAMLALALGGIMVAWYALMPSG
jgi:hypothetical protein